MRRPHATDLSQVNDSEYLYESNDQWGRQRFL